MIPLGELMRWRKKNRLASGKSGDGPTRAAPDAAAVHMHFYSRIMAAPVSSVVVLRRAAWLRYHKDMQVKANKKPAVIWNGIAALAIGLICQTALFILSLKPFFYSYVRETADYASLVAVSGDSQEARSSHGQ